MKFIIANDHAAVEIKEQISNWLQENNHQVTDLGVDATKKADYPDKGKEAAELYLKGGYDYGILCCGTGIGISIAANKVRGIRCALPQNCFATNMARAHNNCQFIAFGARIDYPESILDMLNVFIETPQDRSPRHQLRIDKIMAIEA